MSEQLLRSFIREKLLLNEAGLTAGQIGKGGVRFDTLLAKIKNGEPVNIEGSFKQVYGDTVIIPEEGNSALIAALQAQDKNAYASAFPIKVQKNDGSLTNLTAAGHLSKTGIVKGSHEGGVPLSVQNELDFAAFIDEVSSDEEPITVVIGDYTIEGVTSARQTGSEKVDGETSKADVVFTQCEGAKSCNKISLKLDTAEYWLSGDAVLANDFGPIVQRLLNKQPPETRIIKAGDRYVMMSGPSNDPADRISRIWFEIPEALAQAAVFGSGKNVAQIVAKGNFTFRPTWDAESRTLTWASGVVYESLAEIPDQQRPVGVFRTGEAKRGFTYGGTKYTGIRPVIASKGFASGGNSLEVAMNESIIRKLVREMLISEAFNKTEEDKIGVMARKEIEKTWKADHEKKVKEMIDKEVKKFYKNDDFYKVVGKIWKELMRVYAEDQFQYARRFTRYDLPLARFRP